MNVARSGPQAEREQGNRPPSKFSNSRSYNHFDPQYHLVAALPLIWCA